MLYGICNIDRYSSDGLIEVEELDLYQEIIKSKLKGEYPEASGVVSNYDIKSLDRACMWKSRCLCYINQRKLLFENRTVLNIIIECKICDNKTWIGHE